MGDMGAEGQQGSDATPDMPSISGIAPRTVFAARSAKIAISGYATSFNSTTTVSFGDAITVSGVQVVSPTLLVATIAVPDFAAMGTRDVTVTTGSEIDVATAGFEVVPSLYTNIPLGALQQGDIFRYELTPVEAGVTLPDNGLHAADGIDLEIGTGALTQNVWSGIGYVDMFATTGPHVVAWGAEGPFGQHELVAGTEFSVAASTPTEVFNGDDNQFHFDTRSKQFSFATSAQGIVSFVYTGGGTIQSSGVLTEYTGGTATVRDVQPKWGSSYPNELAAITTTQATTWYAAVGGVDSVGTDNAHITDLMALFTPVPTTTPESTSAHGTSAPQSISSPAIVTGTATSETDSYSFTPTQYDLVELVFTLSAPAQIAVSGDIYPPFTTISMPAGTFSRTVQSSGPGPIQVDIIGAGNASDYKLGVYSFTF